MTSYTLTFVPAFIWLADEVGAAIVGIAALIFTHLLQDDARLLERFTRTVKGIGAPDNAFVFMAADQSFHILVLFGIALLTGELAREGRARLRKTLFIALGIVVSAIGVFLYAIDGLRDVDLDTVDARFSIRGEQSPPDDLVIVKIDDVTFQELDLRWPFRRNVHAKLLRRLAAEKPRAIAYDIQFSEPSEPEREADDIALLEGILATDGKTVLATTEVNQRGEGAFLGVPELLKDINARLGNGLLPNDPGGCCGASRSASTGSRRSPWPPPRWPPASRSIRRASTASPPGSTTTGRGTRSRATRSRGS